MLKKLLFIWMMLLAGAAQAIAPQAGTWVVTSEVNGLPGRGIALDVQNRTLVMQMYAYEAGGASTFYLGVGELNNADRASIPLKRYTGGRYFGSGPRSGVEADTAGAVQLRFTSGTTGFATFPGEPEVAISRFNFAYEYQPNSLKGVWLFTSMFQDGTSAYAEVHNLTLNRPATATGNGVVSTADQRFSCEHQTSGALAGFVKCSAFSASAVLLRSFVFKYSVNEGEGYETNAAGTFAGYYAFIKRISTPGGHTTGIILN